MRERLFRHVLDLPQTYKEDCSTEFMSERENKWIGRLTHDDLGGPGPPQLLPLEIDPKDFTGKAKVTPKSAHRPLDVTKIVKKKKKKKASWLCPHTRSKSRRTGSHFHNSLIKNSKFSLHPVT